MNRRRLIVAAIVVLVAGAGAGAVALGILPPGSDGGADPSTPTLTPTETVDADTTQTTTEPPLELTIVAIDSCGQTCRDVTAEVVNNQDREATGVTVYTRIHAGTDTDGEVVWEGTEDVGTLEPGGTERDTQRVELGLMEAAAVQGAGGEITIVTIIETDRRTVQFVDHRDVI